MGTTKKQTMKAVKEEVKEEVEKVFKISANDAENFIQIIKVVLIDNDLAKPILSNFIQIMKRNNEELKEQPKE